MQKFYSQNFPPQKGQNYKCGALVFNSKCPGDWVAEDCDEVKGGYVCIVHGGNPPPDSYECRQGYTAFGTKCYKVRSNALSDTKYGVGDR